MGAYPLRRPPSFAPPPYTFDAPSPPQIEVTDLAAMDDHAVHLELELKIEALHEARARGRWQGRGGMSPGSPDLVTMVLRPTGFVAGEADMVTSVPQIVVCKRLAIFGFLMLRRLF